MEEPKHITLAKRMDGFFKLLQILTIIALAFSVIPFVLVTVGHLVKPDLEIANKFNQISLNGMSLFIPADRLPSDGVVISYSWLVILMTVASMTMFYIALRFLRKIFHIVINGSPFNSLMGDYIRKLAYLSAIAFLVMNVLSFAIAYITPAVYKLNETVAGGVIEHAEAHPSINFFFLMLFFVLWFFAHIFDYAAEAHARPESHGTPVSTQPGPKKKH